MTQQEINKSTLFSQEIFEKFQNLVENSVDLMVDGNLLGVENLILEFMNQDVVPEVYQKVIKKSSKKVWEVLEEKAKAMGYSWTRVRKTAEVQYSKISTIDSHIQTALLEQYKWDNNDIKIVYKWFWNKPETHLTSLWEDFMKKLVWENNWPSLEEIENEL